MIAAEFLFISGGGGFNGEADAAAQYTTRSPGVLGALILYQTATMQARTNMASRDRVTPLYQRALALVELVRVEGFHGEGPSLGQGEGEARQGGGVRGR